MTENILEQIKQLWSLLDQDGREQHLDWTKKQCATCGRAGTWEGGKPNGFLCDECCEDDDA